MAKLIFHLSGTTLFETTSNIVPQIGQQFLITTAAQKSGLTANSLIRVTVTEDSPPQIEYQRDGKELVHLDVNGYEVIVEG
ncbi:hypothetical protein [Sulfitobacter sp.]|uniref:hypothetical protein n=1 Tax=Sulfitobacter sp. TaxID=1903071 RepID=UPI003EF6E9F1